MRLTARPRQPGNLAVDTAERTVSDLQKRKILAGAVTKIGDGAYSTSRRYGMQQLGAYRGSSHIVVTVFILGTPEAEAKAAAGKVMKKALASLLESELGNRTLLSWSTPVRQTPGAALRGEQAISNLEMKIH